MHILEEKIRLEVERTRGYFFLSDICTLGYHSCDGNATCHSDNSTDLVTCTCRTGFTGNGTECQPLPCDCPGDHMTCGELRSCVCEEGFTLTNSSSDAECLRTGEKQSCHDTFFVS